MQTTMRRLSKTILLHHGNIRNAKVVAQDQIAQLVSKDSGVAGVTT